MNIIELTADNAALYSELVDQNAAECLMRRGYFGAAMVNEGHPLAAMIWQIVNNNDGENYTTSEIVWMAVTDDSFAAKELLEIYSSRIKDDGVKWSSFVFDKVLCKASVKVLGDAGFTLIEREGPDLFTSVGALCSLPLVRIKGNSDNIYEITTLKKRAFNEGIRECLSKTKRNFPEDLATLGMGWFEPEVSCYSEAECILNGLLLVHKMYDGALRVELLSSWGSAGETELALMMKHAISKAYELYPAETKVIIHRHDKASRQLSKYCLPNVKGNPSIYGKRPEGR